jgi:subtilisin family serine protease
MKLFNVFAAKFSRGLAALWCAVLLAAIATPVSAQVYGAGIEAKLAADLRPAVLQGQFEQKTFNWLNKDRGQWLVKVLVVSNNDNDTEAFNLRMAILMAGGSVYHRFLSVNAVLAVLPVNQVMNIANRADVESISPNRLATQSASFAEQVTGAAAVRAIVNNTGLDGRGVGIALLDSGVMRDHANFLGTANTSRVQRSLGFLNVGDSIPDSKGKRSWRTGMDNTVALFPGSKKLTDYESNLDRSRSKEPDDEYGHGTFVAGVAAGLGRLTAVDSTGIAPGAAIYDLKVLNDEGVGQVSDVLAAIDWVLYHHKEYNIRVMNLSLASDSTESYLTDPLCRAVRTAVAAGITVVVAAGNYGKAADGKELYGSIASPGNEPSVITVGSARSGDTLTRIDDAINGFSSRGPTRGGRPNAQGVHLPDNVLKPDLVAPGNNVISAESSPDEKQRGNNLSNSYPGLRLGNDTRAERGVMRLSGTSVAAPAVAGTVALMLQANPGLTPPLIKAALQYSAQPLPRANLVQQGAGLLNTEGAVRIAQALRTDIAGAIRTNRIRVGDSLLAPGKSLPAPVSSLNNEAAPWSRLIFAGGSYVLGGTPLLTQYQAFYDPRVLWVRDRVRTYEITEWPFPVAFDWTPLFFRHIRETAPFNGALSTVNLVNTHGLAGESNASLGTGVFTPTANVTNGVAQGVGRVMAEALTVRGGALQGLSAVSLGEGVVFKDGQSAGVGKVMAEGLTAGTGKVMAETGQTKFLQASDAGLTGER